MAPEDSTIVLTKHEGLGNDFLIAVEPARPLTPEDARAWCDRRRGVGADGLISLTSVVQGNVDRGNAVSEDPGRAVMRLWNADGSGAEISGNGIRCVAQALAMHTGTGGPATFEVKTDAGVRRLSLDPTDDPHTVNVRVEMGSPGAGVADSTAWADLGVQLICQQGVDLGNPHLVALVDDPDRYDIGIVGPKVEAAYPDGLNVHLAKVIDRHLVTMKVWERGSGVTEACGSGACAVGVAAADWGLVDSPVTVNMPGGAVTVEVGDTVHLTGPARFIARVEVP